MTTEATDQREDEADKLTLSPIDEVNRIIDEAFADVPDEEWALARPAMIRWLNEKAGIDSDGAGE